VLSAIKRFFEEEMGSEGRSVDPEHRRRLATCALLLEAAGADSHVAPEERTAVIAAVRRRFGMNGDDVERLLELAEEELRSSNDLYQFTRLIKDDFSRHEKLAVVESLWRVVWSDGVLESHEDAMMHKVGTLLGVDHDELMALKIRARGSDPDAG
jgi:uncharacterized tellurite resistance protein B-like protein